MVNKNVYIKHAITTKTAKGWQESTMTAVHNTENRKIKTQNIRYKN